MMLVFLAISNYFFNASVCVSEKPADPCNERAIFVYYEVSTFSLLIFSIISMNSSFSIKPFPFKSKAARSFLKFKTEN